MDDALLAKIAEITGGHYYRASSTDKEIDDIAEALNGFDKREFSSRLFERLQERYQWFLGARRFVACSSNFFLRSEAGKRNASAPRWIALRRGRGKSAGAAIAVFFLFALSSARADYRDHIREGNRLLEKKDLAGARKEFESAQIDAPELPFAPFNIAITHQLEGHFDDAKRFYEQTLTLTPDPMLKSRVLYNLGHLAFDQGNSAEALEKFKASLRLNPKDMDAKYNVEYIRSGKKPPAQPQVVAKRQERIGTTNLKTATAASRAIKAKRTKRTAAIKKTKSRRPTETSPNRTFPKKTLSACCK